MSDFVHKLLPPDQEWPASPDKGCFLLACSGGLDSTVLVQAMAQRVAKDRLRVIHVNHQLHSDADNWVEVVADHCRELALQFDSMTVSVDPKQGGLEAAARKARYAAFEKALKPGETLVTAHHKDDQVETVLMRLLDGGGASQLKGIPSLRPLSRGSDNAVWRPLLTVSRQAIQAYAQREGLQWVEDPSNQDRSLRRNAIRHELLPAMEKIDARAREQILLLAESAAEQQALAEEMAASDLTDCLLRESVIDLQAFHGLSESRQANLIRYWLGVQTAGRLRHLIRPLLQAGEDAQPLLKHGGWELRRYQDRLYRMRPLPQMNTDTLVWAGRDPLDLPKGCGRVWVNREWDWQVLIGAQKMLSVRWQQGGEKIHLPGRKHRSRVKKLWQAAGVPPWIRQRTPLIYAEDKLLAVGDRWFDQSAVAPGIIHEKRPFLWEHSLITND